MDEAAPAPVLVPDTDVAVQFLKQFTPKGPWILAAIRPEGGGPEVKTFGPDTEVDARSWIEKHNGRRNLYFQVNPSTGNRSKKASKTDIKSLAWLHVDIDPRVGEDVADEQERIRTLLTETRPKGVLEPTCVILSGGGYQAFWRLEVPFPIDGDLERAAEAERYNKQLETLFSADSCHNVDRIMRLPGTVNLPDERKRKKGRVPVLARLEVFNNNLVYAVDQFEQAPADRPKAASTESTVRLSGEARRIADLSDLDKWKVSERLKAVIENGNDPENPKAGDNSRSAWLFDVVCGLLRQQVPEEVVFGIVTDARWPISESVIELGARARAYTQRQIDRARETVEQDNGPVSLDETVARVNRRYFAALVGGKVRWWREGATLEAMDKSAFLFELATTCFTNGEGQLKLVGPAWNSHPNRRYYPDGFVLDPRGDGDGRAYNLWRGFAVDPAPGDWGLMHDHIENVLGSGDAAHAEYILKWTAWTLQNPAELPRVALVFRGGRGVGKGVFARALVDLFGQHGMHITNMVHLVGKFNAHLRHVCLLFADEAVVPNTDGEGTLKGLITEPTIPIEAKGVDVVNADNHLHVVMATNNEWAVPAGQDERRYVIFDVAGHQAGDHAYFQALVGQMQRGGLAAMLRDLLAMDLGGWHPEPQRLETVALSEQKIHSFEPAERIIHNMLVTGEVPCDFLAKTGHVFVATQLLADARRLDDRHVTRLGRLLRDLGLERRDSERHLVAGRRVRGYWLPPLDAARRRFVECLGFGVEWPEDVVSWAVDGWGEEHF